MSSALRAIGVFLASPQAMFRDALRCVLELSTDFRVAGEASTVRETLELTRQLRPDVLLLDYSTREFSGIDALRALHRGEDAVRTMVLVDGPANGNIVVALKYGARGIIPKQTTTALLFKSIRAVHTGEYWVGHDNILHLVDHLKSASVAEAEAARPNGYRLTTREMEIVASIVDGATNKEIAGKLSISEQTVKHHLTSVFGKIGVSNRLELALFAMHEASGAFRDPL